MNARQCGHMRRESISTYHNNRSRWAREPVAFSGEHRRSKLMYSSIREETTLVQPLTDYLVWYVVQPFCQSDNVAVLDWRFGCVWHVDSCFGLRLWLYPPPR